MLPETEKQRKAVFEEIKIENLENKKKMMWDAIKINQEVLVNGWVLSTLLVQTKRTLAVLLGIQLPPAIHTFLKKIVLLLKALLLQHFGNGIHELGAGARKKRVLQLASFLLSSDVATIAVGVAAMAAVTVIPRRAGAHGLQWRRQAADLHISSKTATK